MREVGEVRGEPGGVGELVGVSTDVCMLESGRGKGASEEGKPHTGNEPGPMPGRREG